MMVYELGPFRLDTQNELLFRGREPVALGQRAIAVLRTLVERPGAVVSKDALIEAAWARSGGRGQQPHRADLGATSETGQGARRGPLDRDYAPPRLSLRRPGRERGE
jgi:Transcriptional regulatory protein, C terminal